MKRLILFALALLVATDISAQEKWKPVGNRKIRVVHWGIIHNHSQGKWDAVKLLNKDFELVGWVDDTDSKSMRMKEPDKKIYEGYPCFTPEQVFNEVKPDLIVIETANDDLVGIATLIAEHGIPMHMDKPLGTTPEGYAKITKICKDRNIPLQIGYMLQTNDAINKMVEICKSGILGEVYSIVADMDHNYGYPKYPEYASHYPGGTAYLLTCHIIEWVMPIFDDVIPDRTWSIIKPAPGDPEWAKTHTLTVMEYPRANVVMRVCSQGILPRRHIRIDGSNGSMEIAPIENFETMKHTLGENGETEDITTLVVRMHLKTLTEAAKAAGYKSGLNVLKFPSPTDRYAGQLEDLARIIRGEKPFPEELYEHNLRVHKVSLDAVLNVNPTMKFDN